MGKRYISDLGGFIKGVVFGMRLFMTDVTGPGITIHSNTRPLCRQTIVMIDPEAIKGN